jgi:hypothetical protein
MKSRSFTARCGGGKPYSLISAVDVAPMDDTRPADERRAVRCNAVWDTGASITCVSRRIACKLSLKLYEKMDVHTGGGLSRNPPCIISLSLPNGIRLDGIVALAMNIDENDFDVIIGLDVIGKGDFAVSGFGGETVFSYRHPPRQAIDFERYDYARIPLPADSGD